MKLTRRTVVQAVVEADYGQDPGNNYQAILTNSGVTLTPEAEAVVRDVLRNTLSPLGQVPTQKRFGITLPLEIRGAGMDNGSLRTPETDALLKAGGYARQAGADLLLTDVSGEFEPGEELVNSTASETVGIVADWDSSSKRLYIRDLANMPGAGDSLNGDESGAGGDVSSADEAYVYVPRSEIEQMDSATVRFFRDGIVHPVRGGRTSIDTALTAGQYGVITPTVTGLYTEPTEPGNPTVTYNDVTPERVQNVKSRIGDYDLSGVAIREMNFSGGVTPTLRGDVQADDALRSLDITSREPTGSITLDKDTLNKINPWKDWADGEKIHIAYGYGPAAGKRFRVVHPAAQITGISEVDQDGVAGYSLEFRCTGYDDEVMFIYS